MAMVQLLLGNIGVAGGGMNALRGHSNIQGLTDVGLMSNLHAGLHDLAEGRRDDLRAATCRDAASTSRCVRGRPATGRTTGSSSSASRRRSTETPRGPDNDWAYDWLPKLDNDGYDILRAFEMMAKGEINGYICQGFNPLQSFPDRGKSRRARWAS